MMCLFQKNCPSAKVTDNRLVLSLPDAETPVVWMLSLAEAVTSVLRLETDRQGFFVIKKHGGPGTKAGTGETVAVYRDREDAIRALNCTSKALNSARSGRSSDSRLKRWFRYFVYTWFVISVILLLKIDVLIFRMFMPTEKIPATAEAPSANSIAIPQIQSPAQPASPPNLDAVGVPLSADDYLRHKSTKIRP